MGNQHTQPLAAQLGRVLNDVIRLSQTRGYVLDPKVVKLVHMINEDVSKPNLSLSELEEELTQLARWVLHTRLVTGGTSSVAKTSRIRSIVHAIDDTRNRVIELQ